MNSIEDLARLLDKTWSGKTLAAFRDDATKQFNGTLYETMRKPNGERLIMVICLTGEFEISKALRIFDLDLSGQPADWSSATVMEVVIRTLTGNRFGYEAERNSLRQLTALMFISAEPRSMNILEQLFTLPPST